MPVKLLERIVLACSKPGDVVLDPFAGSGTTLVAAAKHGRRWVGVELSKDYAAGAAERIAEEGVPDAAPPPAPVFVSRRRRRGRRRATDAQTPSLLEHLNVDDPGANA
jgi:hypothetical protein